ncbi:hypothetical protein WA1_23820 [Scytonema hofmannii PCC 7110]|uniref:Filamentous haemagglutinin FhaB/tRNA nuclease CdiA-like TPS domain-containing protein n=1 Tax=Scytonema hofmannii PCC 7110 TaxID=128403 RepID=A0A139X7N8_9CYAN|nr:filamentous hemagglutinin N-terminal domain-containing protein [Scytonema hofmannii]KYC40675.1 hypothetical protein WA1_23820 [Scytonema hofmannii PCC 7110]
MSGISTRWGWLLGIAIAGGYAFWTNCACAQVTPDRTLPNNTNVTQAGSTSIITGGTRASGNLFHSFGEFSVPRSGTAFFNNAVDIQNIISRVTGGSVSNIDGLISANGAANLFLINPNGIIFGRNARLDLGGSFLATTANAIGFGDQGFFSASAPNTPELLTVNPSAFFFNQIAAAPIQNNSVALAGRDLSGFQAFGLRVPDGRSLLLLGGNINMNGGQLNAYGGRVELGGLATPGTVGLGVDGNNLSLSFPDNATRADVFLTNGANVRVDAAGGGSIAVNARNLDILGGSTLIAGIGQRLGSVDSRAGDITLNATGEIKVVGVGNGVLNIVQSQAVGNGGNLTIDTQQLLVRDGAQVSAGTFSVGKAGNLTVNASDSVLLIGRSANGLLPSGLFTQATPNAAGAAGDLLINTPTLLIQDGAQVVTSTFGAGKAGNLTVNASDSVQLVGTSADGQFRTSLSANSAAGDAGDLMINTPTLLVQNGAQVSASTFGAGKGGNLTVNASDSIQVIGTSTDGRINSGLFTQADSDATGNAGNLMINTPKLLIQDGAQVSASTFGAGKGGNLSVNASDSIQVIGESTDGRFASSLSAQANPNAIGDAGNLMINTRQLLVRDGAQVSAGTFGAGKGGSLTVNATDSVQVIGRSADNQFPSSLSAPANPTSTGNAGDLTIKTNTLLVKDGSLVSASTFGAGKGGNLTVDAKDVQLIGTSADGRFSSALSASTESTGNAGNLTIKTNTLLVKDTAQVISGTSGSGNGGNLSVDAQDVQLIGTNADGEVVTGLSTSAQSNSTGDAGDLTIKTNTLLVQDGAGVGVRSFGTGTAGKMTVNARSIRLNNNALLTANTRSAKVNPNREQATININSRDLIMRRGSNIRTNATGENVIGGNINIVTDFLIAVENSDISANSANFRGGNVKINAQGIFGTQFRDMASDRTNDITATGASPEFSGTVELNTPDIDPNSGLVELPTIPVNTEVAQGCYSPNYAQSSFIITGRGGLPPNPKDVLTSDAVELDWVTLNPNIDNFKSPSVSTNPTNPTPEPIVEATGWVFNAKGEVVFTANAPTSPRSSWQKPVECRT